MAMKQKITGFHQDEQHDWVAELECGHNQHVRHKPPFERREWVTVAAGRQEKIGSELNCIECDQPDE